MARQSSHDKILDAVEDVVMEEGAAKVTLDAVAAKAGVSKGGLLYCFPTKEALLHAMMARFIESFDAIENEERKVTPPGILLKIRTHVRWAAAHGERGQKRLAALIAAVAHDPKLIMPFRDEYRRSRTECLDGRVSAERITVIHLALDGLVLLEALGVRPIDEDERTAFFAELLRLAEPGERFAENSTDVCCVGDCELRVREEEGKCAFDS